MPELPEVEVVRRGLDVWVSGRTIESAEVLHTRSVRRHEGVLPDQLKGRRVESADRRGKYLWLPLDDGAALMAHLGMSGQVLMVPKGSPDEKHLRVRVTFADDGPEMRFVDQRTFGHLMIAPLTASGGRTVPLPIVHIAPDPLEDAFDEDAFTAALRKRKTGIKRALLDQSLISGVGNIYADEALWRARLHWARATETLTRPKISELLAAARAVMTEALGQGGTSFDSLYVNVNGESGYFDRSLNVYGRRDEPCPRCGTPIRRDAFMNRSSYSCPTCQPRPRNGRW
ncbi:bifunctional DNA-formamidopyrimidine glycosylase/DNA-(apurinic or apyrimidinic site) lyase [Herbidospora sp. NEAU-GS84]|uniref:Formamidopyrimidine-DNA glycosylase n=1 Tax=Herbidospora solisilvae TaxID=2696284 RepID=A0A7C9JEN3_9ACTN|nr:bifunctional DNA-formamidopyrimidine glycosylase/DNA-(apurinic or apyrimidinic site) lyase [Herbidospora solisilvae]NAS24721.1 bifunctional DNA-formamidopyrimidine glycosylase/DNA-(apurinic or apyrimidinic site) lyase [Herbidospora solisilvae]